MMSSSHRFASNRLGYIYEYPLRQVIDVTQLKPADHIAYYRTLPFTSIRGYWHHAIVEQVTYDDGKVSILHFQPIYDPKYTGKEKHCLEDFCSKGQVVATDLFFWEDEFYVVEHDEDDCLPTEEVIRRAYSKLGNTDYDLLNNNCEHYALWCKIGCAKSTQAETVQKIVTKATSTGMIAGVTVTATGKSRDTVNKTGLRKTWAVSGALEAGHAYYDIHKALQLKEAGKLSEEEFDELVTKRMAVAMGSTAGSVLGASAGAFVAGTLGGILGGMLGEVAGNIVGCAAGHVCVQVKRTVEKHAKDPHCASVALTGALGS